MTFAGAEYYIQHPSELNSEEKTLTTQQIREGIDDIIKQENLHTVDEDRLNVLEAWTKSNALWLDSDANCKQMRVLLSAHGWLRNPTLHQLDFCWREGIEGNVIKLNQKAVNKMGAEKITQLAKKYEEEAATLEDENALYTMSMEELRARGQQAEALVRGKF